ncbi:hypothetical protein PFICI_10833 [Pestalotiopsis fici W106-1]|uniref:Pestheic acid cluster transcriptional regulator 2 n=1 Tax=Pestalotiopsis fici (strain W106-1 / CGMCC3.15140) TaxID=1229662 RepID=PTAR2_PESFW|nr:uncharacterized protein PFICI_10833 [Pestalotiopsis fici W106-1]A0A067XMN9.1 RecName: Full=Pestheic acid cluster transcriptional regulator 2 [Pestalotiopsis fici W106-1]AGO59037.1 PtaR2 [Pestalotiopsis fici]ETS76959.1 hypothetical protein PFICI_10833 [Pestalotiopsis fici W106-1]
MEAADPNNNLTITSPSTLLSNPTQPPAQPLKLRDSCHACASSKVKCHKEKPTCSRCRKRGITCEYFAHRRPGRKQENRAKDTTNHVERQENTTAVEMLDLNWPAPDFSTQTSIANDNLDVFHDIFVPPDQLNNGLTDFTIDFDDFDIQSDPAEIASLPDTSSLESMFVTSPTAPTDTITPNVITPNVGLSVLEGLPDTTHHTQAINLASYIQTPPTEKTPDSRIKHLEENKDPCMTRALSFLTQLSESTSRICKTSETGCSGTNKKSLPESLDGIIAENRRLLEAMSNILQCRCSEDDDLLCIQAIVASKILNLYASAIEIKPSPARVGSGVSTHTTAGQYEPQVEQQLSTRTHPQLASGRDPIRMAAQSVLGELHRVQRLLSQMLQKSKDNETMRRKGSENGLRAVADKVPLTSGVSFGSIEADLRYKLGKLSIEIITLLRGA